MASTVSLADVAPTLLELAGAPALAEASGRSQVPELGGRVREDRPVLLTVKEQFALRGADWKVLVPERGAEAVYFDLASDPGELRGRKAAASAPGRVTELVRRIASGRSAADALAWGRRRNRGSSMTPPSNACASSATSTTEPARPRRCR